VPPRVIFRGGWNSYDFSTRKGKTLGGESQRRARNAKARLNPASDSKQRQRSRRWADWVRFMDYLGTNSHRRVEKDKT